MEVPAFEVAVPSSRAKGHRVSCALTSFFWNFVYFSVCQRSGLTGFTEISKASAQATCGDGCCTRPSASSCAASVRGPNAGSSFLPGGEGGSGRRLSFRYR